MSGKMKLLGLTVLSLSILFLLFMSNNPVIQKPLQAQEKRIDQAMKVYEISPPGLKKATATLVFAVVGSEAQAVQLLPVPAKVTIINQKVVRAEWRLSQINDKVIVQIPILSEATPYIRDLEWQSGASTEEATILSDRIVLPPETPANQEVQVDQGERSVKCEDGSVEVLVRPGDYIVRGTELCYLNPPLRQILMLDLSNATAELARLRNMPSLLKPILHIFYTRGEEELRDRIISLQEELDNLTVTSPYEGIVNRIEARDRGRHITIYVTSLEVKTE